MGGALYATWKDSFGKEHNYETVATYEGGKVYSGSDEFRDNLYKGQLLAEYEEGRIYRINAATLERAEVIAVYDDGRICGAGQGILGGVFRKQLSGTIFGNTVFYADNSTAASFEGDEEGAAAAAAVALFELDRIHPGRLSALEDKLKFILPSKRNDGSLDVPGIVKTCIAAFLTLALLSLICMFLLPFVSVAVLVLLGIHIVRLIKSGKLSADSFRKMAEKVKGLSFFEKIRKITGRLRKKKSDEPENDFYEATSPVQQDSIPFDYGDSDKTVRVRRISQSASAGTACDDGNGVNIDDVDKTISVRSYNKNMTENSKPFSNNDGE